MWTGRLPPLPVSDPDQVSKQVETEVGGTVATQVLRGEQIIDVRVRLPQDLRQRADALRPLTLRSADGSSSPAFVDIAQITIQAGQRQIMREDLAPFIPVTARLEGKDLGTGMAEVQAAVAALHLPSSVRVDYGGLYQQQKQSFRDLTTVFIAALLLSALLLTLLFETWAFTAAVISTVLLSTSAVFMGLWVTGTELDISALMGLTMVIGMLTELAIFYLAELVDEHGVTPATLLHAGKARLRPILMSALIAILTLSPLALGIGRGSGLQRPLATADHLRSRDRRAARCHDAAEPGARLHEPHSQAKARTLSRPVVNAGVTTTILIGALIAGAGPQGVSYGESLLELDARSASRANCGPNRSDRRPRASGYDNPRLARPGQESRPTNPFGCKRQSDWYRDDCDALRKPYAEQRNR